MRIRVESLLLLAFVALARADLDAYEYDDEVARLMLKLSAAAYNSRPEFCLAKLMPAEQDWRIFDQKEMPCDIKGNTCALYVSVSKIQRRLIVSFRGTVGKEQLDEETFESLQPDNDWYGMGLIDRYFYYALNQTWPYVESALAHPEFHQYHVTFTGYSLGGALASLASVKTVKLDFRPMYHVSLVTFGQPRVGNSIFANNHNRYVPNSYRIVHNADIVPHLPPCRDDGPYGCSRHDLNRAYHHGTEVWYKNDMSPGSNFMICTRSDEDEHCSNSFGTKYTANDHLHYFGHKVSSYGINNCTDVLGESGNNGMGMQKASLVTAVFSVIVAVLFM
ncbi:hypothetical protein L596_016071 [Steinernema carpocapsae]|uniref:Fungal lipase-type domain-containing protein n=1 Tax=Steinernema carpocapsae TaxID=34508 RepID=A0A4U5NI41_STECR|nr:hypothetical protein L596_016071 [Steinernema carpocapsae]